MHKLLIGILDTGVNPWHSHVRGAVTGCRVYLNRSGEICEDGDFRDQVGHGTAVAAVVREALPTAALFAIRLFEDGLRTYPSLVARGILRAAAEGCSVINLSLAVPPGCGDYLITEACAAAREAGSILVAAGDPLRAGLLPASLPGVYGVICDNELADGEIEIRGEGPYACHAPGRSRRLGDIPSGMNLSGHSLACARVSAHLAGIWPHVELLKSPRTGLS